MQYRPDIDGLRSIAVLFVILFHFGFDSLSGGYVGVDVFFVLSGYLIGSILFNHLEQENFSFSYFYFRRIRRLFPVYIVVIIATTLFAYLWMLPKDFREYGQSLFASTIYASNILFYLEAGYFDTSSHIKPLLHTWSLSVEEQFYLIFPFVAWATYKISRSWAIGVFIALTLISFVLALLYIEQDNSAVFYMYPFRAWEMFIGTLLALRFIPTLTCARTSFALATIGIGMIFYAGFAYDDKTLFPGLSALLPCVGTGLIIYTGKSQSVWIHHILATRIPVFIGQLSYSLYLWHWPVYVLYTYNRSEPITIVDGLGLLALVFVLSYLSWKFVEAPFRKGKAFFSHTRASVFTSTAVVSALFLAIGLYIDQTRGMPSRLSEEERHFASAASDLFGDLSDCTETGNERYPNLGHCEIGDTKTAEKFTLVWGDSHGGAFRTGYEKAIDGLNNPTLFAWAGGCPTAFNLDKDESVATKVQDAQCLVHNNEIKQIINDNLERINAVVFISRWSYYLNGGGIGVDDHNKIKVWRLGQDPVSLQEQKSVYLSTLEETFNTLHAKNIKIFVLEQPPEFSHFNARKFAIGLINGSASLEEITQKYALEKYENVLARQAPVLDLFNRLEQEEKIELLKTHSYFCNGDMCSLLINDMPTYFDNNHVSSFGAEKISSVFDPFIQNIQSQSNESH